MYFPFIKRSHTRQPQKDTGISIQDAIVFAMSKDYDVTDGGEFIDDGMRMKEQPLTKVFTTDNQPARPYSPLQIQVQSQSQSLRPIFNHAQIQPHAAAQPQDYSGSVSRHVAPDPWRYFPSTAPVVTTSATPTPSPSPTLIPARAPVPAAAPALLSTPSVTKAELTGSTYKRPEEVVRALKKEGYTENFATDTVSLYGGNQDMRFHPSDFTIDKTFRFNCNCGPNGNPIVYAITSTTGVKGTLTDTTGTCALHPDMANMVKKVYINNTSNESTQPTDQI